MPSPPPEWPPLDEAQAGADPFALFDRWFREAAVVLPGPAVEAVAERSSVASASARPHGKERVARLPRRIEGYVAGRRVIRDAARRDVTARVAGAEFGDTLLDATAMTLATVTPEGRPAARVVLLKAYTGGGFDFYTGLGSAKARDLAATPYAALVFHWPPLARQVRATGPVARLPREAAEAYFATRPRGSQLGAWASPQSRPVAREELDARVAAAAARFEGAPVPCPPHWGGYRLVPEELEFWQGRPDRLHDRLRFRRSGEGWLRERLGP